MTILISLETYTDVPWYRPSNKWRNSSRFSSLLPSRWHHSQILAHFLTYPFANICSPRSVNAFNTAELSRPQGLLFMQPIIFMFVWCGEFHGSFFILFRIDEAICPLEWYPLRGAVLLFLVSGAGALLLLGFIATSSWERCICDWS